MHGLRAELVELKRRIALLEARLAEPIPVAPEISIARRSVVLATVTAAFGAFSVAVAPSRAIAANGSPLLLGNTGNASTTATQWLVQMAPPQSAGWGLAMFDGFGGSGPAITATFLSATSGTFSYAVAGLDTANTDASVLVTKAGVYGYSNVNAGVVGTSPGGVGVFANGSKLGLKATTDDTSLRNVAIWAKGGEVSTALAVDGKLRIALSGKITIAADHVSATVTWPGSDLTALGFAMVQSPGRDHFVINVSFLVDVGLHPVTNMKIKLNDVAPAGGIDVGWFVIYAMGTTLS